MFTRMGLLFLLLVFLIVLPAADAQNDWQIPDIECGEGCMAPGWAVDAQGNLYIYVQRQQPLRQVMLYLIPYSTKQLIENDLLQLYPKGLSPITYFAPLADYNLIVFSPLVPQPLTLLKLQTQTVIPLDTNTGDTIACDRNSHVRFAPSIYRVGSDKVLFCSVED